MKAGYVPRFSRLERLLHWVNALGFFFLLATGLILYLPSLSVAFGQRTLWQDVHFWSGIAWVSCRPGIVARIKRQVCRFYRWLGLVRPRSRVPAANARHEHGRLIRRAGSITACASPSAR